MNLFFSNLATEKSEAFDLEPEESRHIVKVLRKGYGDVLWITNGKGLLLKTEILNATPKKCSVRVLERSTKNKPPLELHLAVAPTKRIERYQWMLEKGTEIGVSRIIPVICERSERKVIPMDKFNRVIQEASKQSLQTWFPELEEAIPFSKFIETEMPEQRFIAHCEPEEKYNLTGVAKPGISTVVLIGPEGDFTPREIEMAKEIGFKPLSLGPNRLRTETAAIAVCAGLNLISQV
jgi:16S rRNA (uracil1498-N3)-methyltransferase